MIKKIQAMSGKLEGQLDDLELVSLLTALPVSDVAGTINRYKSYASQVTETYRKYNNKSDFGCQQIRAVADIRTAFTAGEGVSIACKDPRTSAFIERLIDNNKLSGSRFMKSVLGTELSGQSVLFLEGLGKDGYPKIQRLSYDPLTPFRPVYRDENNPQSIYKIMKKDKELNEYIDFKNNYFVYVKTGGDDSCDSDATTKLGIILTDAENYDRTTKDMRRTNHILARITPTFKTQSKTETIELLDQLGGKGNTKKWKIGDSYVGTADFNYKTPGTGTHENLTREAALAVKTIASVTGVPVHWIGWVDLMSNRATAESLYDTLGNATSIERITWQEAIYDLIILSQEYYIDAGGTDISRVNRDFDVRIPVIDFSRFLQTVQALSLAFNDRVISKSDYQNNIPGINPLDTNKALEEEEQNDFNRMRTSVPIGDFNDE